MRKLAVSVSILAASIAGGLGIAWAAGDATVGTNVSCATATASLPAHTVGVDGTDIDTISGTSTVAADCETQTYTIPTNTETDTATVTQTVTATPTSSTTSTPTSSSTSSSTTSSSSTTTTSTTSTGPPPPPGCTTTVTPATFSSSVSAAAPGSVLCLAAGAYSNWSGASKTAPGITITAAPGAAVTLPLGVNWSLASLKNFTVDGTLMGGSITVPANQYVWSGSTTSALNVTIRDVVFAPSADLDISSPTNAAITFDHDSFNNSDCEKNEGVRLHLSYSNNTQSGITVQNSAFIGGSADGIQTGDPMTVQNNLFQGIQEGSETQCHSDALQLVGAAKVATVIKGNYFLKNADGVAGFDGPLLTDIEDNVFDQTTENNSIDLDSDTGSVIMHNTIIKPANGTGIDLTSKANNAASKNTVIRDNILDGAEISLKGGGCNCTATPSVNTSNMLSAGAAGSNFAGTPVFAAAAGGSHDAYLLSPSSPGVAQADDGTDVGVYAQGAVTYGPVAPASG